MSFNNVSFVGAVGGPFSPGASQIEVWCLRLHLEQLDRLWHSDARCSAPVQLKHNRLSLRYFLRSTDVITSGQLIDV
jgi:hypothetical protein